MAIVRFDPFRELTRLQDALVGEGTWVPPVDIFEASDKALVIKAELPEMQREAIAVTVENGALTISGERRWPAEVPKDDVRRVERAYGRFSRRFTLPTAVDASRVAADYKDGVLTVRLPMREDARPRTVPVAVAS
ncbi:MAG: Hsp20/alpha crystallin family protein [Acidobacteria bacterium]|nr:Hsp20/alpha crystallin family protein [Acidobacteriota bacterium]